MTQALDEQTLAALKNRLMAFARDCVEHGDMSPTAARLLKQILGEYG